MTFLLVVLGISNPNPLFFFWGGCDIKTQLGINEYIEGAV